LPSYPFGKEIELLNRYVVAALDRRRSTQYDGQCGSYGETLLNCYLDLFVTLTVFKTPREIEAKPSFLVNPATGSVLELAILLEDFRLAFEFQGEHHYVSPKVIAKDAFKLAQCARFERILIPVNPAQLASTTLQTLIRNSIKDYLGLGGLFSQSSTQILPGATPSPRALLAFSKAVQRIYLSRVVFFDALTWCDGQSTTYLAKTTHRSPIASTTPAPRFIHTTPDVDIETIYRRLPAVTSLRKSLTTVQRTHG